VSQDCSRPRSQVDVKIGAGTDSNAWRTISLVSVNYRGDACNELHLRKLQHATAALSSNRHVKSDTVCCATTLLSKMASPFMRAQTAVQMQMGFMTLRAVVIVADMLDGTQRGVVTRSSEPPRGVSPGPHPR
jgi:hypothetical protein